MERAAAFPWTGWDWPGVFSGAGGLQTVAVELEQVVGGGDDAPFGAGGREASAFEAVDAPVALIWAKTGSTIHCLWE